MMGRIENHHLVETKDDKDNKDNKLSLAQKILLFVLFGLIILMIIFSFGAMENSGADGYNNCIEEKCENSGEEICQKFREINNCCLGAGGNIAQGNNGYTCVFS